LRRSTVERGANAPFQLPIIAACRAFALEPVDAIGLSVCLMRATIFDRLEPPGFQFEPEPDKSGYVSEDFTLFRRLKKAGVTAYVDHGLSWKIGHIGDLILTTAAVGGGARLTGDRCRRSRRWRSAPGGKLLDGTGVRPVGAPGTLGLKRHSCSAPSEGICMCRRRSVGRLLVLRLLQQRLRLLDQLLAFLDILPKLRLRLFDLGEWIGLSLFRHLTPSDVTPMSAPNPDPRRRFRNASIEM
jgi:hypothetical protein